MNKRTRTLLLSIGLAGVGVVGTGSLVANADYGGDAAATDETGVDATADDPGAQPPAAPFALDAEGDPSGEAPPEGACRPGPRRGPNPEVVAEALGLTVEDVRAAHDDGLSIADLAAQEGVDLDTVVDAIVADVTAHLADAVDAGEITQEQADERLDGLADRVAEQLTRTPDERPERGARPGGPQGQAPAEDGGS